MSVKRVGAIVLAGGRSSRFGRDKLVEHVDGQALLDHAIDAVRAVATDGDVVVVMAPGHDIPVTGDVRVVRDPFPYGGPLVGLATGLQALDPRVVRVVVVGGDMPTLQPVVLRRLLGSVGPERPAVLLEVSAGEARASSAPALPAAFDRAAATAAAGALVNAGERRLRALAEHLGITIVPWADWQVDDPDARTLHDIDTPDDL